MGGTIARSALLMFDGFGHLRGDVLNQRAASGNVEGLQAKTDRKERDGSRFDLCEHEEIGFILDRMNAAELGVRLASVAQRVHVRITARQQNAIKAFDDTPNKVGSWDKRNVNR